ncbi:hypothetical protein NDU88_005249 [Pleurodeles waltl]|uniref:Uncharacterized protein n=1 Tax=Pleurodeles waltl TaxID=8319 RepID=A0AAV7VIH4_PLEWA|nr:hypothetical protein NDU88_005249 [Pleurodeles waltl]
MPGSPRWGHSTDALPQPPLRAYTRPMMSPRSQVSIAPGVPPSALRHSLLAPGCAIGPDVRPRLLQALTLSLQLNRKGATPPRYGTPCSREHQPLHASPSFQLSCILLGAPGSSSHAGPADPGSLPPQAALQQAPPAPPVLRPARSLRPEARKDPDAS